MVHVTCDLCGAEITAHKGRVSKVGVLLVPDRSAVARSPQDPNEVFWQMIGGKPGRDAEPTEFEACYECALALVTELKRRQLEIKKNGRVETV